MQLKYWLGTGIVTTKVVDVFHYILLCSSSSPLGTYKHYKVCVYSIEQHDMMGCVYINNMANQWQATHEEVQVCVRTLASLIK